MDNENIVLKYAKQIFGFAYAKTHNSYDAEDLSQEILLQILNKQTDFSDVENMDAYIYRICCYTWSNYLRKNKPEWNMINCSEEIISLINAPEFTEWSVEERRKFRCGAVPTGYRRRICFRPFAVCDGRQTSGIDRGYADSVIVHEYVPENDALHLISCPFVRGDPVDLFLLQGCEKTFHSRIVKAMSGTAETLKQPCLP